MTERTKDLLLGAMFGVLITTFIHIVATREPHENPPISTFHATLILADGSEYYAPKNVRYKSYHDFFNSERENTTWTPFAQGGVVYRDTIYVFCMEDEEGETYTAEISTIRREDIFIIPKSCPTNGACTLGKDCSK